MTFKEYQDFTVTTDIYPVNDMTSIASLSILALGLNEEAGEYAGKLKKTIRDNGGYLGPDRRIAAAQELGDVLWYLTRSASLLGYDLSEIAQMNKDKLVSRLDRNKLHGDGDER